MRRPIIWAVVLLCLATEARADGVTLPRMPRGDLAAQLTVEVLDRASTPGLAEVRCTVVVEGGQVLEVEPVLLGDAVAGWRADSTMFAMLEAGRQTHTEVLELHQVKPGPQPLPSVKVRFRGAAAAKWEEAEWVDLLKPALTLQPEAVPELPVRPIPWWAWALAAAGMAVVAVSLVELLKTRSPKPAPPTPEQWALEELTRLQGQARGQGSEWYHTRLSYIVRRFLEEKHGLRAPRQTTGEFLESVREAPQLSEEQRELLRQLLERCDLAKFAPVQVSSEDCRQATELARTLVLGACRA